MRSPRDVAASTNHEAARRLVRSLVGVVDVAFRYGQNGRVESVSVLPATGAHERQVRLNVASGLMAGFGIALDPAKVELVRTSDELRAIEAESDGQAPGQAYQHANGNAAGVTAAAPGTPFAAPSAPAGNGSGAPATNGNGAHATNGNGAHGPAPRTPAPAASTPPPRPVLKPRVPEGAVGLAARAFHALDDQNMRPPAPPAGVPTASPAPARADQAPPAPVRPSPADPRDDVAAGPQPAPPAEPRRVRLVDDDAPDLARDASVRPFPAQPAATAQPVEPAAPAVVPPSVRSPAPWAGSGRGGAAAALALPVEPAPPAGRAPGVPALEVAEVVAARGATFCRVVVEVDGERYTGVAETMAAPELDRDPGMVELVARITVDALRSARVPREPTQFHGATTVLVAGKPFVVAVLRCWNGRSFDDLCAVEPIHDSPEEAAALAVLKAAASRNQ